MDAAAWKKQKSEQLALNSIILHMLQLEIAIVLRTSAATQKTSAKWGTCSMFCNTSMSAGSLGDACFSFTRWCLCLNDGVTAALHEVEPV